MLIAWGQHALEMCRERSVSDLWYSGLSPSLTPVPSGPENLQHIGPRKDPGAGDPLSETPPNSCKQCSSSPAQAH